MKILLALLLCTLTVGHPVNDPNTQGDDVVLKVLDANPSENDILLRENETTTGTSNGTDGVVDDLDPTEKQTSGPEILSELEKAGEELLDDVIAEIERRNKTLAVSSESSTTTAETHDTTSKISEKTKGESTVSSVTGQTDAEKENGTPVTVTTEVGKIHLDPLSDITEHKPTEFEVIEQESDVEKDKEQIPDEVTHEIPDEEIPVVDSTLDEIMQDTPVDPDDQKFQEPVPVIPDSDYPLPEQDYETAPVPETEYKPIFFPDEDDEKIVVIPLQQDGPFVADEEQEHLEEKDTDATVADDLAISGPLLEPTDTVLLDPVMWDSAPLKTPELVAVETIEEKPAYIAEEALDVEQGTNKTSDPVVPSLTTQYEPAYSAEKPITDDILTENDPEATIFGLTSIPDEDIAIYEKPQVVEDDPTVQEQQQQEDKFDPYAVDKVPEMGLLDSELEDKDTVYYPVEPTQEKDSPVDIPLDRVPLTPTSPVVIPHVDSPKEQTPDYDSHIHQTDNEIGMDVPSDMDKDEPPQFTVGDEHLEPIPMDDPYGLDGGVSVSPVQDYEYDYTEPDFQTSRPFSFTRLLDRLFPGILNDRLLYEPKRRFESVIVFGEPQFSFPKYRPFNPYGNSFSMVESDPVDQDNRAGEMKVEIGRFHSPRYVATPKVTQVYNLTPLIKSTIYPFRTPATESTWMQDNPVGTQYQDSYAETSNTPEDNEVMITDEDTRLPMSTNDNEMEDTAQYVHEQVPTESEKAPAIVYGEDSFAKSLDDNDERKIARNSISLNDYPYNPMVPYAPKYIHAHYYMEPVQDNYYPYQEDQYREQQMNDYYNYPEHHNDQRFSPNIHRERYRDQFGRLSDEDYRNRIRNDDDRYTEYVDPFVYNPFKSFRNRNRYEQTHFLY